MQYKPEIISTGILSGDRVEEADFKLSEAIRANMLGALKRLDDEAASLKFLDLLETAVGIYIVHEKQRAETRKQQQRIKALKQLSQTANQVREQISDLDSLNYRVIEQTWHGVRESVPDQVTEPSELSGIPDLIRNRPFEKFLKELEALSFLSDSLLSRIHAELKPGAPPKIDRQRLFDAIMRHYQSCFGRLPSTSSGGPIETVLKEVLPSCKIVISDLHSEIIASLKRVRGK